MKLKLDLHDVYNSSRHIVRCLRGWSSMRPSGSRPRPWGVSVRRGERRSVLPASLPRCAVEVGSGAVL